MPSWRLTARPACCRKRSSARRVSELVMATRDISRNWWKDDIRKKLPRAGTRPNTGKELEARRKKACRLYHRSHGAAHRQLGVGRPARRSLRALWIGHQGPFAFPGHLCAAYANDYAGYIPTRRPSPRLLRSLARAECARGGEGGYLMADKTVELLAMLAEREEE